MRPQLKRMSVVPQMRRWWLRNSEFLLDLNVSLSHLSDSDCGDLIDTPYASGQKFPTVHCNGLWG